jgi:hypothetical protein
MNRGFFRRLRESIGRASISIPGMFPMALTLDRDEPRQESKLAKIVREGGRWWEKSDEPG